MLENIILALNKHGWRIGSLCQLQPGWYACLIDDEEFVHCASGETAKQALEQAMITASSGRLYDRARALAEAVITSDDKIDLAALGLVKPREPINRRF